MTDLLLVQLYSVRATLDAAILAREQELGAPEPREPGACPECGAPPDQVKDASTIDGTKRSRCGVCGAVWER